MRCKFCGCTESAACPVPVRIDEREAGGVVLWNGAPEDADGFVACQWIAPEVCSAPACVKKAYAEAVERNCQHSVELGLIPPEQAEQVMRYLIDHGPEYP